MPSHDKKGRSNKEAKHVRLYKWELECSAYRSLGVYSRCLLIELKRRYTGTNNGHISMSVREAESLIGCSRRPVLKAFDELQGKGFIRARQKGSFDWKRRHASEWVLTEYGFMDKLATKDFMSWRPTSESPPQKISRVTERHPTGALETSVTPVTGALETPDGCTRDTREAPNQPSHGCLRDTTVSLPAGYPRPQHTGTDDQAGEPAESTQRDRGPDAVIGDIPAFLDRRQKVAKA